MKRTRRNTPPYFDIKRCLDLIRQIYDKSGGTIVKSALAGLMKSTEKSSTFIMGVASLKEFGFVTVESGNIKLTSLALSICRPTSPGEKKIKMIKAFLEIEGYKRICDLFKGGILPEPPFMTARIERDLNLSKGEAELWVESFIESANEAGIFKLSGGRKTIPLEYADLSVYEPEIQVESLEALSSPKDTPSFITEPTEVQSAGKTKTSTYKAEVIGGDKLVVIIPEDIDLDDLEYVKSVVDGWITKLKKRKVQSE